VTAGTGAKAAPSLQEVFGREAGLKAGVIYSLAVRRSALRYDDRTLDWFIEKSTLAVPGTSMAFRGTAKPRHRKGMIGYLKQSTQSGQRHMRCSAERSEPPDAMTVR
jgi:cytochrome c